MYNRHIFAKQFNNETLLILYLIIMNANFTTSESNFCQETYNLANGEYQLIETEIGNKDSKFKNNFLNSQTLKFFRSIGGKETVSQGSKFGLGCTISESISPDKMTKKLTYFFY